jgi:DnaK suppressor protein
MDPKKREKFRNRLLELRAQVINRGTARLTEALKMSQDDLADETDHAAAVIQQNVSLAVQERDRWLMVEIEHALMKFEDGSYGLCEDTEEPIDEGRLDAQPWTRYSVEAAEVREKRAKRFASNSG